MLENYNCLMRSVTNIRCVHAAIDAYVDVAYMCIWKWSDRGRSLFESQGASQV